MDGRHGTRRRMLGTVAGVSMLLLGGLAAGPAGAADNAKKRSDFADKEHFELECELLGGTYSEDGLGNTECHFPDGSWIECDANGKDCWYTPAPKPGSADSPGYADPSGGVFLDDRGTARNEVPAAQADAHRVAEDRSLRRGAAKGVLANDADPDGDRLAAKLVKGPRRGRLTLNPDGSFTYRPRRDFHGTDRFTYEVRDGQGGTTTAMVTVEVLPRPE